MFSTEWRTSQREYGVEKRRDVPIPVDDGSVRLAADIFLPEGRAGPVPVLLGAHCYNREFQMDAPVPVGPVGQQKAWIESGDPNFYVRRGYGMINLNVRGSGNSDGSYQYGGQREVEDVRDAIEWIADQEWSDGSVGTFGISYYSVNQQQVAMLNPEPLKCIFAPWAWTDWYRDMAYHGGILAKEWIKGWPTTVDNARPESETRARVGDDRYRELIADALEDEEIVADPALVSALENPAEGANPLVVDAVLNRHDTEFWRSRSLDYEETEIPAYLGADWAIYGFHLPGAFRSWRHWQGPTKLLVGPPIFLDRPLYQLQYESLRWFDHWLKGMETGILDEPAVRLFVTRDRDEAGRPVGDWETAEEWPLPETRWTPFYLHDEGLLSEHEIFTGVGADGTDAFRDSPFDHEAVMYETPPFVEETVVCGPIRLNLYASTTADEELFFVTLFAVDADGTRDELTRGWLRGSQRATDPELSEPWYAHHPHEEREPLTSGEVHEFNINVRPTARRFLTGQRLALRIKAADVDDEPPDGVRRTAIGHVETQTASRVTVYRNDDYPSHLLVPITHGNVLETYMTGGVRPQPPIGPWPREKVAMEKSLPEDAEANEE